jgi:hypothetical protein
VARSLARRNGYSLEKGLHLWLTYLKAPLTCTAEGERILVAYEDLMEDPRRELFRLARFLGRQEDAQRPDLQQQVQEFLDVKLQHHRTPLLEPSDPAPPAPHLGALRLAQEVYLRLKHGGRDQLQDVPPMIEDALELLDPEIQRQRGESFEAQQKWEERLQSAAEELERLVSDGERLILVDDAQLAYRFRDQQSIPFLERGGQYWGPPPNDEVAIQEFERLRCSGASFLVFAWPAFWWLEYYGGFRTYLQSNFRCLAENNRLVAFDLRSGA